MEAADTLPQCLIHCVVQPRKGRVLGKDEIKGALVERLGDLAMRQV